MICNFDTIAMCKPDYGRGGGGEGKQFSKRNYVI